MLDLEEIIKEIPSRLRKFIDDVRFRHSDETILLYVKRDKVSKKASSKFTSERQMLNLSQLLREHFSKDIQIVYTLLDDHLEIESALHQILNHHFDSRIVSVYMSFLDDKNITSWIEAVALNDEFKNEIQEYYKRMLEGFDYISSQINWINSEYELPKLPWLLRFIKTNQPIALKNALFLVSKEFPCVDKKWLNHKLDSLRKKGLIIREKTGNYVLTAKGLSIIPAGAVYRSSDIDRILALGRKKW